MRLRGRGLRLTAVLAIVMLALTGFSRSHHRYGGHSSGGGGCSSSRQDHDTSSSGTGGSTHVPDDTGDGYSTPGTTSSYGSGGYRTRRPASTATPTRGTARTTRDGSVRLVSCASAKKPYATVEVSNPNSRAVRYRVSVRFLDGSRDQVGTAADEVRVPADGHETLRLPAGSRSAEVEHCEAGPVATPAG